MLNRVDQVDCRAIDANNHRSDARIITHDDAASEHHPACRKSFLQVRVHDRHALKDGGNVSRRTAGALQARGFAHWMRMWVGTGRRAGAGFGPSTGIVRHGQLGLLPLEDHLAPARIAEYVVDGA